MKRDEWAPLLAVFVYGLMLGTVLGAAIAHIAWLVS